METFTLIPQKATNKELTFKQWVNEHADVLFNYCLRHGFDEHNAKDFVQETFLSAWRSMESFEEKSSVKTWLCVILKNKIADHFRRTSRQINATVLQPDSADTIYFDELEHWKDGAHPKEWSTDFIDRAALSDFQLVFRSCSSKLKKIQSIVFIMKYVDDLNSEIICKELNITPSNYWVILHRAKVQLRACIEKNWALK